MNARFVRERAVVCFSWDFRLEFNRRIWNTCSGAFASRDEFGSNDRALMGFRAMATDVECECVVLSRFTAYCPFCSVVLGY